MNRPSLANLPDDLILDIVQHLDTARDVAHLGSTSRHAHEVINQSGWRSFVRAKFPSIDAPTGLLMGGGWNAVADRLTYLDRCWDTRGFHLTVYGEKAPARPKRRDFARNRQSVNFHSVIDAATLVSTQEELLAYGAGENLVIGRRGVSGKGRSRWSKLGGRETGYAAGTGDVTAISIIERQEAPEVVVGRADGDVQLLSVGDETLLKASQSFASIHDTADPAKAPLTRRSPGQRAISWTEWQPEAKLLASCRSSVLTLYNLSDTEEATLKPVLFYDVSKDSSADEVSLLRSVKFMGQDVVACGIGGSSEPLRWAQIRPTGIEFTNAAKNIRLSAEGSFADSGRLAEKTTVRAIQPVSRMNQNLLLSAWDDGSHRISDLRTPSDHDVLYRDGFQPYQGSSSLLVYGSERFVAGNNCSPDLRFFDFRFPKAYHHTSALPCSADAPFPGRPYQYGAVNDLDGLQLDPVDKCDSASGRACTWHHLSRQDSWRPDAVMHIYSSSMDRVHCLAKASDLSTSFYCGVRGALVEATHALAEDVDAVASSRSAPEGWQASDPEGRASLIETGVGRRDGDSQLDEQTQTRMPELYYYERWTIPETEGLEGGGETARKRETGRRLDPALVASRRSR
ncbi:uncharacterized protein TRIREDRAFT_79708 [Trichoderma reesei QM6a]|uniref:Predicted protein n=2 Tax=Hypocrea jecorina TaxID=51453 RepID=G0RNJ1_HYPJQ|nr:uncharacterized protein TRIREDRAFT_79708 [Trichoderma reesei QM6a]EGR47262.1 predicted protein [Trichoderma reesei QM6a]ETS00787.1 hypothetical protein M419DRAFT_141970 [Trichoderma reesei RUT C-30]